MRASGVVRVITRRLDSSRLVVVGVVVMTVLGTAGFVIGRGEDALRLLVRPGDAWLSTSKTGSVSLVDGLSGRTSAALQLNGAGGHQLVVTQVGGKVLVLDASTGLLVRVNPVQLLLGASIKVPKASVVVAGLAATYVVNYGARTVERIDPVTLRPLGPVITLPGQPDGSAVVDRNGTLWVPLPATGSVIPVTENSLGHPFHVSAIGADVVMTSANGLPIAVDRTARKLTTLGLAGAKSVVTLPASAGIGGANALLVPASGTAASLPMLDPNGSPSLVIVNLSSGTTRTASLGAEVARHRFGVPVQAGQRIFIPDYTTGSVLVYETAVGALGLTIPVLGHPGAFAAEVIDGVAYFNDPNGDRAVVVTPDGQVHQVSKGGPHVPTVRPSSPPSSPPPPTPPAPAPTSPGSVGPTSPSPTPHPHRTPRPTPDPHPTHSSPPPPLAPANPTATAGAGFVDVSWQPAASGGPVRSYQVAVSPGSGSQAQTGPTSVRVTGLSCGTTYSFTVSSVGTGGQQVPAQPVTAMPCVPPSAPQSLTTSVSPGQIQVSWAPPASDGGGLLSYTVSWGGGSHPGLTGTSDTITGLANFQSYTVTVTASNGAGTGGARSAGVTLAPGTTWGYNIYNNSLGPVNVRPGPSQQSGASIGQFGADSGAPVQVICQVIGGYYQDNFTGVPSGDVWDRIVFGGGIGYVADGYVTTPNSMSNSFSPPIWPC